MSGDRGVIIWVAVAWIAFLIALVFVVIWALG